MPYDIQLRDLTRNGFSQLVNLNKGMHLYGTKDICHKYVLTNNGVIYCNVNFVIFSYLWVIPSHLDMMLLSKSGLFCKLGQR